MRGLLSDRSIFLGELRLSSISVEDLAVKALAEDPSPAGSVRELLGVLDVGFLRGSNTDCARR